MASTKLINRIVKAYVGDNSNAPSYTYSLSVGVGAVVGQIGVTKPNFYGYNIYNPNGVPVFLKIWDFAIGIGPVLGVTIPNTFFMIPAQQTVVLLGTDVIMNFTNAMWIAITTGYLDTDAGAPALGCPTTIFFKN
jgi:hypothetical protein